MSLRNFLKPNILKNSLYKKVLIIGVFFLIIFVLFGKSSFWSFPIWNALVAIGSIGVIFFSYYSIQQIKKERETQLNREIIEKIYKNLIQSLQKTLNLKKIENFQNIYPKWWKWEEIKEREPYLIHKIPSELYDEFNKYTEELKEYEKTRESFKKKFEETLVKIVKDKKILPEKLLQKIKRVENVFYSQGHGPFCQLISLSEIFFSKTNLKEVLNGDQSKGKFFIDFATKRGLKREEINEERFIEIYQVISNYNYILQSQYLPPQLFRKLENFHKKTKSLKEKIENEISKLATESKS